MNKGKIKKLKNWSKVKKSLKRNKVIRNMNAINVKNNIKLIMRCLNIN